jgi:hypothetical protein
MAGIDGTGAIASATSRSRAADRLDSPTLWDRALNVCA